jgi:hypothetical protein
MGASTKVPCPADVTREETCREVEGSMVEQSMKRRSRRGSVRSSIEV